MALYSLDMESCSLHSEIAKPRLTRVRELSTLNKNRAKIIEHTGLIKKLIIPLYQIVAHRKSVTMQHGNSFDCSKNKIKNSPNI